MGHGSFKNVARLRGRREGFWDFIDYPTCIYLPAHHVGFRHNGVAPSDRFLLTTALIRCALLRIGNHSHRALKDTGDWSEIQ